MQHFNETEAQYRAALLRSDLASAERMLDPDRAGESRMDRDEMKLVQVIRYDVKETAVSKDKLAVSQIVEIQYYRHDRPVQKTAREQQEWRWDEEKRVWLLHSGFPQFQ
jgi:hypothetical protein